MNSGANISQPQRAWSRRHPVVAASGQLGVANLVDGLAMLAQVTLMARFLSKEEFGLLGMALGWTFVASAFLDFRVWEVMTIVLPKLKAKGRMNQASALVGGCFLLELFGGLLTSLILVGAAWPAAAYYARTPESIVLFLILAAQPLLMSADEPSRTVLKLAGKFRTLAVWRGISAVLQLAIVVGVLVSIPSASTVAMAIIFSWVVKLVAMVALLRDAFISLGISFRYPRVRRLIFPTLLCQRALLTTTMLSSIAGRLNNRLDVVILGSLSLPETVASYDLARRLTSQISLLIGPVEQVMFPRLSHMIASKDEQTSRFLRNVTIALAAAVIPGIILAVIVCPYIIPWAFDDKFASAVIPTQILILAYLPTPLLWMRSLLAARMDNRFLMVASYCSLLLQVFVGLAFVPTYGVFASALSIVAAQGLWWCLLAWRTSSRAIKYT